MNFARVSERVAWARFWMPPWGMQVLVCVTGCIVLGVWAKSWAMAAIWVVVYVMVTLMATPRVSFREWQRFVRAWRSGDVPSHSSTRDWSPLVGYVRRQLNGLGFGIVVILALSGLVLVSLLLSLPWIPSVGDGVIMLVLAAAGAIEMMGLRYHQETLEQRLDVIEQATERRPDTR